MYEFEKYDSHMYDKCTMHRGSDVWNEWTVHVMCTRDGVCDVPGVNTLLGRRDMYVVPAGSVLERNGVYRVHGILCRRNI